MNYYNEIDPYCVGWLKNLIVAGHIPKGEVDDRDIRLVSVSDLAPYRQCHFFAGIAGWSLALRLAGWPSDRPVWTGSCPCQPFSVAGARKGFADERHLAPDWLALIRECKPPVVFGEQVASASKWLAGMRRALETLGYAVGAMPVEAASVGAPHKRDRYWFVADSNQEHVDGAGNRWPRRRDEFADGSVLADAQLTGCEGRGEQQRGAYAILAAANGSHPHKDDVPGSPSLALPDSERERRLSLDSPMAGERSDAHWGDYEWIAGADGKARRVKPGVRLLAHGVPARVAKLRALGNAIVPQVAAEFIGAYLCR